MKVIYNILYNIKKQIKFENYYFSFFLKKKYSNPMFSTLQFKTLKKVTQKLIKLNNY